MIDKVSNYILDNVLYKNEQVEGDTRDVMLFGITRIVEDIPKAIAIFIICWALNLLELAAVVLIVTILYKGFVGGAHANSNISCFIFSTLYFLLPVFIGKYITISNTIFYILLTFVFIFSSYVLIKIAPADTEQIPILNKSKRKLLKILGFTSIILMFGYIIFLSKSMIINMTILSAIFLMDIIATKPIYRFLKCKYSYEVEEFKEYFN